MDELAKLPLTGAYKMRGHVEFDQKGNWCVMTEDEIQFEDDKLIIEDVARAVEEQELIAYYQPVIDLTTGSVASLEALVRWTIEDGTVVPAALFVPSLDRTDTIFGLDWFMAEHVCGFLDEKARGTRVFVPTALNISARHAADSAFASKYAATIGWHNIGKDILHIELSDANVKEGGEQVRSLIDGLRDEGFTVYVDNYVSGAEGLAGYKELGVGLLKVASSWWKACEAAELAAFVSKASELGIGVVAEGVESEEELVCLKEAGFRYAKGYHLGKPVSGEELVASLG